jgi:hypothetical protein
VWSSGIEFAGGHYFEGFRRCFFVFDATLTSVKTEGQGVVRVDLALPDSGTGQVERRELRPFALKNPKLSGTDSLGQAAPAHIVFEPLRVSDCGSLDGLGKIRETIRFEDCFAYLASFRGLQLSKDPLALLRRQPVELNQPS